MVVYLVVSASCSWRLPESRIHASFTFFLTFPNPQGRNQFELQVKLGRIPEGRIHASFTLISPFLVVVAVQWLFGHVQEKLSGTSRFQLYFVFVRPFVLAFLAVLLAACLSGLTGGK